MRNRKEVEKNFKYESNCSGNGTEIGLGGGYFLEKDIAEGKLNQAEARGLLASSPVTQQLSLKERSFIRRKKKFMAPF